MKTSDFTTTILVDQTPKEIFRAINNVRGCPEYECYSICSDAWNTYIKVSLCNLIAARKGQPNSVGNPKTEDEKRLSRAR